MTETTLTIKTDTDDPIARIEALARSRSDDLSEPRILFRHWLFERMGEPSSSGSVGDALAALARSPAKDRRAAIVTIRCLAIRGLIPEPNDTNHIVRSIITLCEGAVPELCDFLRIDAKSQNYEKFAALSSGHQKFCELLRPVADSYGDIDSLMAGRKAMLGALNHSIVRAYGEPFRLADIRNAIEGVFSRLKRIAAPEATFLQDYEECHRSLLDAKAAAEENGSFLATDFLLPFLDNTETVLGLYLSSVRARFYTRVSRGGPSSVDLQKRYPLYESGREFHITIPLRNEGPGMATDLRVSATTSSEDVYVSSQSANLGNVLPGDFSVVLDAMVMCPTTGFRGLLEVEWGELGNPTRQSEVFEFGVLAQASDIDWHSLEYWTPYSTDVAEGPDFIGRMDKVRLLASKLLRTPMEPFYVTGQKRIGKTSLAIAAADFAVSHAPDGEISYHYILWGDVAHADPRASIRQLGQNIENFIASNLPAGIQHLPGDYDGSLSPLVGLSDLALKLTPKQKFVIIIDEFDEVPQELYLHGNLAETFFANLRALSRRKNICLVIVGGENMPYIMDRQGQKLNNFSRINLDYFSRETEWNDFIQMVRTPSAGVLNWHDDAISEVFNISNGNPFYAKIVCAGVVRESISERDADITSVEVKSATEAELSILGSNSFVHLWQDGIPRAIDEREPDVLRRSRVLVAAARCLREPVPLTASSIADHRASHNLLESEVPAVLNDFIRRDVLREVGGVYSFVLPIFGMWLADVGVRQLVADSLSDELAQSVIAEENAVAVRSEEVVALSKG